MTDTVRDQHKPDDGPGDYLIRLPEVLKWVRISRSAWYAGMQSGQLPTGHLIGPRTRVWKASEIFEFIRALK